MANTELGRFLRRRRARRSPAAAGWHAVDGHRRVPGLRREELALLANVSPSYYARLERGVPHRVSVDVLDAIATVLGLDADERAHLHALATGAAGRPAEPTVVRRPPTDAVRALLGQAETVPALLSGPGGDVLAWNRLGHALFFSHLPFEAPAGDRPPNLVRQLFLDERAASVFDDWEAKARDLVAHLRATTGDRRAEASAIADELCAQSPAFAALWDRYEVGSCPGGTHRLRHPLVGTLRVIQQALTPAAEPDRTLVLTTPEPGDSAAALARLAATVGAAA